jgi:predicted O-methyltransferase YrrM
MQNYLTKTVYWATDKDHAVYNSVAEFLSSRSQNTPYHCAYHSVHCFRNALTLVNSFIGKAPRVFEIGFNLGHSSAMMLSTGASEIVSVDIRHDPLVQHSERAIKQAFPNRHQLFIRTRPDFKPMELGKFDMAFIDGGHELNEVIEDIELVSSMGIRYMLFDDILPQFGPYVIPAIEKFKLAPLAVFGNIGLFEPIDRPDRKYILP